MGARHRWKKPPGWMYEPYGPGHAVARAIGTGSQWFHAWIGQYCLPLPRLKKKAGIGPERARELFEGAPITMAEVEALALACDVQPSDIIASLPDPGLLIEDAVATPEKGDVKNRPTSRSQESPTQSREQ